MDYSRANAKEASKAKFKGIFAAITTPFTADGQLDEPGLRGNMRHLIDRLGVTGVFSTGVIGEFWSLTLEERRRITEIVVEEAHRPGHRYCVVIAHTAHHSAAESIGLTQHAEAVGADFGILMNPYYPPCSDEMVFSWVEHIASRVNIGIWLFDAAYSGYSLSPALISRLADIPNICGLKSAQTMEHYVGVNALVKDRIVVSMPNEFELLSLIRDHGQQVHQSSPTPYLFQTARSRPIHDYSTLAWAGRYGEAKPISDRVDPIRAVYDKWLREPWRRQKLIAIQNIKAWTEELGMAAGPIRPPLLQISDDSREELRSDLKKVGLVDGMTTQAA